MKKLLYVILFSLMMAPLLPSFVDAQTSSLDSQVRGLEVGPFLLDLDVPKGGNISSTVDIANRSNAPLIVTIAPRDFLPGEEGQPRFIPDTVPNDETFSLASWIEVKGETRLTLQPGQVQTISFTLNPPADAEQGTHYGALLFSYAGINSLEGPGEVLQTIGTIILVRYGEARENGVVEFTSSAKLLFSANKITFENKFINTGNVHVQPKGEVYVKNIWGQIIETPFVNRDAANVLPKTDRTFVNSWYPSSFAFGRYTVETVLHYGRGRLEARGKHHIWVLPWYLLIPFCIIVVTLLWFLFHGRHWHKRRVIRRHIDRTTTPQ